MDKDSFINKADELSCDLSSFLDDLGEFVSINPQFRGLFSQLLVCWSNVFCFAHDLKNKSFNGSIIYEVSKQSCENLSE